MTLPFPIQFASNGPQWAQGFDAWYDYTKPQGSQLLAFPPATDTHSATVSAQSSFGGWQAIPANVPSRTDLGMQTVPTRTNSIRNNSMSGAIAGSPGTLPTGWGWDNALPVGMTKSISNTGTENGLPYVDVTISGTAGAAGYEALTFTTSGLTAMSAGQTWTASSFFRTVSGVIPAGSSLYMRYETSVGATTQDSAVSIALLSSAFQRVSTTNTNAPATTANGRSFLLWSFANGLTYNFTLRIYAPQLELGAFASAPILTTSGAATVNGNQQVVDLTGRLSAGVGGIIQVNLLGAENDFVRVIEFNDGTGSNYVMVRRNVTGLQMLVTASGVPTAQFEIQTFTLGPQTIAFAASPNYAMARAVGQSAPTADVTVTYPTITRVSFGGEGFGTFNNMYQLTRRVALRFGAQNASTFADLFSKATILAAVS